MKLSKTIALMALATSASAGFAQNIALSTSSAELKNVVQLTASATVELQQDTLNISLTATKEGADALAVQNQLKTALDAALSEAKKSAQAGQMDVRTGNFSLSPRYGRDGRVNGWQGTTELLLQGKAFVRLSATAGKIQTMTLGAVSFSLSREQRQKAELDAQVQAIERYKAKAADIAKGFGFAGYTLREVTVQANDQEYAPRPHMMAMATRAMADSAPVPVEAGKATVQVSVSGAVQLR